MKRQYILMVFVILLGACSGPQTDSAMLKKDQKELEERLDSYQVGAYRFIKIIIRASAEQDTLSPEFLEFKEVMSQALSKVKHKIDRPEEELSTYEILSLYNDYRKMKKFVDKTDEDVFPTLVESMNYTDENTVQQDFQFLKGEEKLIAQNREHAVLSCLVLLSNYLGTNISLYECYKTQPDLISDSEEKMLLQFLRGFVFFTKGLYYLSEVEISRNIEWLNKHPNIELPLTKTLFSWSYMDDEQVYTVFHSFQHFYRGFDRLMMDREIDEERALQDFEVFLAGCNKVGVSNELVWSVESYLYLKKEDNDKAVLALRKLKGSPLLSDDEKERMEESIVYVENREPGKVLNSFFDKYFLAKIGTKYIISVLSKVDWKKWMKENEIPHTDKIFEMLESLEKISGKLGEYTDTEQLKEKGEELKEQGKSLWKKAKELWE